MSDRQAFLDAVSGEVNDAMEEWDTGALGTHGPSMAGHVTERLEKAGALRMTRRIATAEELNALPYWSIVKTRGSCFVRSLTDEVCWVSTTGHFAYSSAALIQNHDSVTVIHEEAQ
ncbi:hypothetical protein SEA_ZUCKER_58 [Arthrobacter phage Zucker]|nr:hypothetical protein SEA_ZUCKER_58 [Arthrobacter phage Zucker]